MRLRREEDRREEVKRVSGILWKNDIGRPALDDRGFSKTDDTYTLQGSGNISGTSDNYAVNGEQPRMFNVFPG